MKSNEKPGVPVLTPRETLCPKESARLDRGPLEDSSRMICLKLGQTMDLSSGGCKHHSLKTEPKARATNTSVKRLRWWKGFSGLAYFTMVCHLCVLGFDAFVVGQQWLCNTHTMWWFAYTLGLDKTLSHACALSAFVSAHGLQSIFQETKTATEPQNPFLASFAFLGSWAFGHQAESGTFRLIQAFLGRLSGRIRHFSGRIRHFQGFSGHFLGHVFAWSAMSSPDLFVLGSKKQEDEAPTARRKTPESQWPTHVDSLLRIDLRPCPPARSGFFRPPAQNRKTIHPSSLDLSHIPSLKGLESRDSNYRERF